MSLRQLSAGAVAGNVNTDFAVGSEDNRKVLYGHVILSTDATVASRRVIVQVLDASSNLIFDAHSGTTVSASTADQHHAFMQGIYRETSFIGSSLQVPIPIDMALLPGWTLRVNIENGQAGDSYDVEFVVDDAHLGASFVH